jgi:DNA-directed RNA polymerase subunit RPC12/RpoP
VIIRWVDYKCPSCGKVIKVSVIKKLSLGPEIAHCQYCGVKYRTGRKEWARLRSSERFEYFFTEDVVGSVLAPGPLGFICGYYAWDSPNHSLPAGLALLAVCAFPGLVYVGFAWVGKVRQIKLSLKRCPEENAPVGPNSIFPWRRTF